MTSNNSFSRNLTRNIYYYFFPLSTSFSEQLWVNPYLPTITISFSPVVTKARVWGFPPKKGKTDGINWNERTVLSAKASTPSSESTQNKLHTNCFPQPMVPLLNTFKALPGSSIFSVSVWRLKGSVAEFSRCLRMMDLSMMVPDGSLTGSVIRVSISGSGGTRVSLNWRQ